MSYGCEVWYNPNDKRVGWNKPIYPLQTIQNKCLRAITGPYKTTNVHMLEHEVSIEPLNLHLEEVAVTHALRSADTECCRAIVHAYDAVETQASQRLNIRIKRPHTRAERLRDRTHRPPRAAKNATQCELERAWALRWQKYREQTQETRATVATAQSTKWNAKQYRLCKGLLKQRVQWPRSCALNTSDLTTICTAEKCPTTRALCDCGWPRQTIKHVLLFYPRFARDRDKMIQEASTNDYTTLLLTVQGIRAVTKWFLRQGILTQFSLASEAQVTRQRKRGRRAGNDVDDG